MVAASVLAAAGRHVISIDDGFGNAEDAGLAISRNASTQPKGPRA